MSQHPIARSRSGFTLIELSIVLVIIGLIVGGVLVGRDLIKAAEYRKIISEIESFRTATNTFKIKYDCLAGDCPNATTYLGTNSGGCPGGTGSTGTCNGDGNMLFGYWGDNEPYRYWQHLSLAKLIAGQYTGVATPTQNYRSMPGINVPPSVYSNTGISVSGTTDGGWAVQNFFANGADNGAAIFILHQMQPTQNGPTVFMPPTEMRALDRKYDDGLAISGKIRAEYFNSCVTSTDPAIAVYSASTTGLCIPLFSLY